VSVSVVIPLFDKGPFIERCLRSVLGQTVTGIEVIVVDDGSTDSGPQLVERLADPRVALLRQARAGAGAARNRGWQAAARPLVAFLDADDEWQPTFLEKTLALAGRYENLVAIFTNVMVTGSGPLLRSVHTRDGVVPNYFEAALANGAGMCASSVLIRRAALESCGGFAEGRTGGEDVDTWARLAWTGPVGHVPECLAVYHTEASTPNARDPTCYPALLGSFEAWERAGRIPTPLLPASRSVADRELVDHCVELAHAGRGREARSLILARWHGGGPRRALLKPLVWSWLPPVMLRALRRTRANLERSALGAHNRLS
jgi:hypothetical protein